MFLDMLPTAVEDHVGHTGYVVAFRDLTFACRVSWVFLQLGIQSTCLEYCT